MKKKINLEHLLILLGLSFFLLSCVNGYDERISDISNQTSNIKSATNNTSRLLPDCGPNEHAVLTYSYDGFNFHRPKYGCESGFWFCFEAGHWSQTCVSNVRVATIEEGRANLWAQENNGKLEIHFPIALKSTAGYTSTDLATFNVDDEYEIYEGITMKMGDYPVIETATELVVLVDIK